MNLPESHDRPSTYLWLAGNEGLENGMGKNDKGLYKDYYKDPFRHSYLTKGKSSKIVGGRVGHPN